ncbi:MAG: methyltransferase [Proteobacteria bacterium]|nr:MAG: methyltransferase [Pseudomonadota bacterium]
MSNSLFEIVPLKSGVNSLRLIANNETFHPGIGPIAEANILHVLQHRFAERASHEEPFILWDVGLGAAANAIAAMDAFKDLGRPLQLHSFDRSLDALVFALAHHEDLGYPTPYIREFETLIADGFVSVNEHITWHLHLGDFAETMRGDQPSPHSIFYDPYSPRGNVDMWNLEHFTRLRACLNPSRPCLMSNYSRSTYVRVTWLLAGFFVGTGTAIGEKEETSLAATHPSELLTPLPKTWLNRVKISHSSAPLRGSAYTLGPIEPNDYADLTRLPQFV